MTDCWSETEDLRPSFLQLSNNLEKLKEGNVSRLYTIFQIF